MQPYQRIRDELERLGLPLERHSEAAWWIDEGGRIHRGHETIAAGLAAMGGPWRPLGALVAWEPLRPLWAATYHLVSRIRGRLPSGPPALGDR